APGSFAASAAFGGSASKPSCLAGTRTPLTPPTLGVRPNVGGLPWLQYWKECPGCGARAWQAVLRLAGISPCAVAEHASMPTITPAAAKQPPTRSDLSADLDGPSTGYRRAYGTTSSGLRPHLKS